MKLKQIFESDLSDATRDEAAGYHKKYEDDQLTFNRRGKQLPLPDGHWGRTLQHLYMRRALIKWNDILDENNPPIQDKSGAIIKNDSNWREAIMKLCRFVAEDESLLKTFAKIISERDVARVMMRLDAKNYDGWITIIRSNNIPVRNYNTISRHAMNTISDDLTPSKKKIGKAIGKTISSRVKKAINPLTWI